MDDLQSVKLNVSRLSSETAGEYGEIIALVKSFGELSTSMMSKGKKRDRYSHKHRTALREEFNTKIKSLKILLKKKLKKEKTKLNT